MTADLPASLPAPVRTRVVALAAEAVGQVPLDELPLSLRPIARFTPKKRIRYGAPALASALDTDPDFRKRVAEMVRAQDGPLVDAVADSVDTPVPSADPVEVAAIAYLVQPDGWQLRIEQAVAALEQDAIRTEATNRETTVARLEEELRAAREDARARVQRATETADDARRAADELRHKVRMLTGEVRRTARERDAATAELGELRRQAEAERTRLEGELRRLTARLSEAQESASASRTDSRRADRRRRDEDQTRLRLLVETLSGVAHGLRDELALPPSTSRPADLVADPVSTGQSVERRGVTAGLDRLLALPQAHLVVDGYNVTKTGYGDQPLAAQRDRLIGGLGALVSRLGVLGLEVTCVFDGAVGPPVAPRQPRGVRVLFSDPGELADDVIGRLVAAEPRGRPVVVVSSDQEVATAARRAGHYALPAAALLDQLDRG